RRDPKAGRRLSDKIYTGINRLLVKISRGNTRYVTALGFVLALLIGTYYSRQLRSVTSPSARLCSTPLIPTTWRTIGLSRKDLSASLRSRLSPKGASPASSARSRR